MRLNRDTRTRPAIGAGGLRLAAWLAVGGFVAPVGLEAQACLGFGGDGFVAAAGAVRREWSENTTGIGAAAGLSVGPVAAAARFLKFSGADEFEQEFDFQDSRLHVALSLPPSLLSACPVVTVGFDGISSRDFSDFPYKSAVAYGVGAALGRSFSAPGSGLTVIPSLIVSVESHEVERLIEGDIVIDEREVRGVVRGGVSIEFGRLLIRPHATLNTIANGYVAGGALLGLTF